MPRLTQKVQLHSVKLVGASLTSNCVAPQWQLALIGTIEILLKFQCVCSSLVDAVPSSWVRRFKSELNFAPINRMTSSRCHWFCNKETQRGSCSNHFL